MPLKAIATPYTYPLLVNGRPLGNLTVDAADTLSDITSRAHAAFGAVYTIMQVVVVPAKLVNLITPTQFIESI